MSITVYLSLRGDGAWRVVEAFRRALGPEADSLVVHPNRDESGFYGSADVSDVGLAREAFIQARAPYPQLKAHLSAPGAERATPQRGPEQRSPDQNRPPSPGPAPRQASRPEQGRSSSPGSRPGPRQEQARPAEKPASRDRGRRRPRR